MHFIILILASRQLYPVVFMHGITLNAGSMEKLVGWVEESIPGLYTKNCEVGNGRISTIVMPLSRQIELMTDCINSDPKLANGFIGVGLSQGGVMMRAYLQMHNHDHYRMVRFVSLSAPLGGYFCGRRSPCLLFPLPEVLNELLSHMYEPAAQLHFGPAGYWRDPRQLDLYNEISLLAELDQLRPGRYNQFYRDNFMGVDKVVLIGSSADRVISPWQSAWFGTWGRTDTVVVAMEDRPDYQLDLFGLKSMVEQGRVVKIDSGFTHIQTITSEAFAKKVVAPWCEMEM